MPPLQVFGREGERTDVPALLPPREGVQIALTTTVGTREITRAQFNERVLAARGGQRFSDAEAAERARRFAGRLTVPEAEVEDFLAWCRQAAVTDPKVVNLFR